MLKECIEKIESMSGPKLVNFKGLVFSDKPISLITEPHVARIELATLTGLVDLIKAKVECLDLEKWILHVLSFSEVCLIEKQTDAYGRRTTLVESCHSDGQPFQFGHFLDREKFVIGLQSRFAATPDLTETLKIASNLTASTVAQAEDDGIAQRTTVKQGVTLKDNVTVKARVTLKPYRTFREVDQPESEFIFRLRSLDGGVPECALFEADGGKWKLDAVLIIKKWLESHQLGMTVVA